MLMVGTVPKVIGQADMTHYIDTFLPLMYGVIKNDIILHMVIFVMPKMMLCLIEVECWLKTITLVWCNL